MTDKPKNPKSDATGKEKKSWLAGANEARKAARAEKAASKAAAAESKAESIMETTPEGSNGKKTKYVLSDEPSEEVKEDTPEFVLAEKKKLHREIFEKCVEKKMFQEMGFWES